MLSILFNGVNVNASPLQISKFCVIIFGVGFNSKFIEKLEELHPPLPVIWGVTLYVKNCVTLDLFTSVWEITFIGVVFSISPSIFILEFTVHV